MNEEKKYSYQEDVQMEIDEMVQKRKKIIETTPTFYLEIEKAPYILPCIFKHDGTPNGDFIVPERFQKKASFALQHPHTNTSSNKTWFGNSVNDEYLIKFTPDFLSEEELDELQKKHSITKRIGNTDVKLKQRYLGMEYYASTGKWKGSYSSTYSDLGRKKIKQSRELLQECSFVIEELKKVQLGLPHKPREVTIEETVSNKHK